MNFSMRHSLLCNNTFWIQEGKRAQFEQGRWLRRRYDRFLGELYHPDVMAAQSTDVDRTMMSAMLTMAGLWPPGPEQQWHPDLAWQPVPIRTQPLDQDDVSTLTYCSCGPFRPCKD